jgi:hypothetical protein
MWETNTTRGARAPLKRHQGGTAAIEFALLAIIFFTLVFGVLEVARAMFVFNTLQEVTRRAASQAAVNSHRDLDMLAKIKQYAVLRSSPGELVLGSPITDRNVKIDYLALIRDSDGTTSMQKISDGSLPTCPRQNREICMANPNAANCIRFARARICADDGAAECNAVDYRTIFPLVALPINASRATTISVVESFGSMPEGTPCL